MCGASDSGLNVESEDGKIKELADTTASICSIEDWMMLPRAFNSAKPSSEIFSLVEGHCQILDIDRTCETYPGEFWVVDVAILLGEVKGGGFVTEDDVNIVEQRDRGYHGVWRDDPRRPSNAAAGHGVQVIEPGSLRRSFVSFAQVKALEIYILPFSSHSLLRVAHFAHCTGPSFRLSLQFPHR